MPHVARRALSLRLASSLLVLTMVLAAGSGWADDAADNTSGAKAQPKEIIVRAKRFNAAQSLIQPDTGASTYTIPQTLITSLPGGDNASINQVILQTPGAAQDSFGQLHIRGDHNNIQFRLNGIILPEGLSAFGQVLSPRYAESVTLITGALPAEYGLRTAGVVNIKTKSGLKPGGEVSIYGGSHGTYEPSLTYGGSSPSDNYFVSLSYRQSQLGVEAPYNTRTPLHDRTSQVLGFGYYDHIIDDFSRLSFVAGASDQKFQLPNTPGLHSSTDGAGLTVNGISDFLSDRLNGRQHETTNYAIASYLRTEGDFTGQISLFARDSRLIYTPDWDAELAFNGLAQYANKGDQAFGLQAEGSWVLNEQNTVRSGLIVNADHTTSRTKSAVLEIDASGVPITDVPTLILDQGRKNTQTASVYLQNEWKPLEQFVLNYGVRYDRLNAYRKENQVSPRVNFVWTPAEGTTVHGGYSRYFTPPPSELIATATQSKFTGTTGAIDGVNDVPYAERDNYYDIGMQQVLSKSLSVGIDSYYRIARRLIDEGQFGAPIILTPFNFQDGRNSGVELSVNYDTPGFGAYFNFAKAKAQGRNVISSQFNFDPGDLAYIADHYIHVDHDQTTSVSTGLTWKLGDTKLSFDGIYGSGLRKDGAVPNGAELKGYTQINASVGQHIDLAGGFDLRLDIINLFDRAYQIRDGSGIGVGAPQWGPRRGVFVGISRPL